MLGLIGKKVGMTTIFDEIGRKIPCTVISAEPNIVTQVKTVDTDGYNALQIGAIDKKARRVNGPEKGHADKAKTNTKRFVIEVRDFDLEKSLGDSLDINLFKEGQFVDVVGTSKGKGFQGVVKRHGFSGVGESTHGQHNRLRAPGSIGAASTPSRVFKGMKMAGRMGGVRVTMQNLKVLKIDGEKNLIVVKGAIPGHNGAMVIIER